MNDFIEKEIKDFISDKRFSGELGRRNLGDYTSDRDLYLFVTDQLVGSDLEKMLEHLKGSPQDQQFVAEIRSLIARASESENQAVPAALVSETLSKAPQRGSVFCPHCQKPLTPFKKPLRRQKLLNAAWAAAGFVFFIISFLDRRHFVQWSAFGALCLMKWIVDQKSTRTQILVYKALSEQTEDKTHHLHRADSHL